MTNKEKMLKIMALAMSIKATDSYYLSGVTESYTYDGVIEWLERMKREWGEV